MPDVNPKILKWARETSGLSLEEATQRLGLKGTHSVSAVERLAGLERGDLVPTRPLVVKMAKQYRRPLLTFYLPDVPKRGDRGEDFRTLPEPVDGPDAALVDAVVRDIRTRQSLVRASLEAADEARSLPFIGSMSPTDGVAAVVASIEERLGFDRDEFRRKGQLQASYAYLRSITEAAGVFVLLIDNLGSWHTTISVEAFRGFALADDVAPFIAINANDSPGAWSFTHVHELAHLWIGATGVSGGTGERTIEKFCNDVASEFLLPQHEIAELVVTDDVPLAVTMEQIGEFASRRNVSNTMVAYKLYRANAISFDRFLQLKRTYRTAFLDRRAAEKKRNADKEGGPTFYVTRTHRVGKSLIQFVDRMMNDGNLSATRAGKVLGVGAHNVHALIDHSRPKHAV